MILEKIFNKEINDITYGYSNNYSWGGINRISLSKEAYLKESTYLKCINYTSNKIATLSYSLKYHDNKKGDMLAKKHPYYNKFLRPNNSMSFVRLMKALVVIGEHEGISCLYINRANGDLFPCRVNQIFIDDVGIIKSTKSIPVALEITCNGVSEVVSEDDCILYHGGITTDGITSKAFKDYMELSLKTTMEGQKVLSKLFESGLTNKAIIQLVSDINNDKELSKIQNKFKKMFTSDDRLFTIPAGYRVDPFNLSLADSQFKELRSLSRREIASLWGVTPSMLGEETSGSTDIEAENLRYLTDTLHPKIKHLEQEFNYKYLGIDEYSKGFFVDINFNVLLKTTAEKQKNIIVDYVKHGIYPLEYARELLGVPLTHEGIVTLPSGQVLLRDLLEGNVSYLNKNKKDLKGGDEDE
ncbi:MAG: phage portal protein [Clostridium sp.]